jgi:tRNA(Leu) C34 or U34 (ribose-2'-O)-methylase TrmL
VDLQTEIKRFDDPGGETMKAPGVILVNPKYLHNVAAAIRACSCFGLSSLLWTGDRVDPTKFTRLPREERMKGYREVEWQNDDRPIQTLGGTPVCVEIHQNSIPLSEFQHPEDAVYVFGPEDGGVPAMFRRHCHFFVHIPSYHCLNLAAALNVVLYDRAIKLYPAASMSVAKKEMRGEIPVPGWEGE